MLEAEGAEAMTEARTLTLAEFLLARIAEDEERAGHQDPDDEGRWQIDDHGGNGWPSVSPARVLAECEAKRRIVEHVGRNVRDAPTAWTDRILKLLAAPYADHPDYREEWRP